MTKKVEGKVVKVESEWTNCESMKSARSNFAVLAMTQFIYVYGGIKGQRGAGEKHKPQLVEHTVERYTIASDSWDIYEIPQAPKLAAFAWCRLTGEDKNSIVILGGSDGYLLTSDMWVIDFDAGTAAQRQTDFDEYL